MYTEDTLLNLTLVGPGFFPGAVFRDNLKISRTIQGSPMRFCTVIVLLKVYHNA